MSRILDRILLQPWVGKAASCLRLKPNPGFRGSQAYWEERYAKGGSSGAGSHGRLARFKAELINDFVKTRQIGSLIELGCGDGRQLELADYPRYLGLDVSETAIRLCRRRFAADTSKAFCLMRAYTGEGADLALSLDVIYHLVEDEVFEEYMTTLFQAAIRYVIIYSTNSDRNPWWRGSHVRHRHFTRWVEEHAPEWDLTRTEAGTFADFYFYERIR